MTNKINYLKHFFKVLIWPIIFLVGQFLLVLLFSLYFNINEFNTIKTNNSDGQDITETFNNYVKTTDYSNKLSEFINSNMLLITIITFIIFIIIFKHYYKKYQINYNQKISFKTIMLLILIGTCINTSYNIIMSNVNSIYNFTNAYDKIEVNILISIICTGILGPILEEFLFRGIIFNKFKNFNKQMTSILLTSFVFAFCHSTFIQILYAFCLSFILIYVYDKYKTIKAPIIVHITSNIVNIFICLLIMKNIYILNITLLIISIIVLFIINQKLIKKDLSHNS